MRPLTRPAFLDRMVQRRACAEQRRVAEEERQIRVASVMRRLDRIIEDMQRSKERARSGFW